MQFEMQYFADLFASPDHDLDTKQDLNSVFICKCRYFGSIKLLHAPQPIKADQNGPILYLIFAKMLYIFLKEIKLVKILIKLLSNSFY